MVVVVVFFSKGFMTFFHEFILDVVECPRENSKWCLIDEMFPERRNSQWTMKLFFNHGVWHKNHS